MRKFSGAKAQIERDNISNLEGRLDLQNVACSIHKNGHKPPWKNTKGSNTLGDGS